MKRALRTFAAGARVYAAGAEVPDAHPVAKAVPAMFEDVPAPKKGKGKKSKGDGGADGNA